MEYYSKTDDPSNLLIKYNNLQGKYMKKLYPVKMTKYNLEFLLSACDWLEDKQLKYMIQTKILSRLVALGFWGYSKRPITHKLPK